jgi:hypothetical protein
VQSVVRDPAALKSLNESFKAFADPIIKQVPSAGQPAARLKLTGSMMHVGAVPKVVVEELEKLDKPLNSAVLTVRDEDVVHAVRPQKASPVDRAWYLDLPLHLAAPDAVLLDTLKGDDALVFVYSIAGNDRNKIVVMTDQTVNTRIDGQKEKLKTNVVRGAQVVSSHSLTLSYFTLLYGKL